MAGQDRVRDSAVAPTVFTERVGDADDAELVLALFDESIAWMIEHDLTSQWGATPFSQLPKRVEMVRNLIAGGDLRVAERDGEPVGVLIVGAAMPYVPPATEPELYVQLLLASHRPSARGTGAFLLRVAENEARRRRVGLLRVDCFAGNDRKLVCFYERCGFTATTPFTVGEWPGQVLELRL